MIRAVPLLNLIHPVPERHQPAIRCRRQITEHQRISRHRLLCLELSGQLTLQAADPRLGDSARVMSDQPRQPVIRADPPQEPGAIQRMKSRLRQVRGIPDVMKPRRRRQQLIRQAKPGSNLLTTSTSALDMPPPTRQHRIQVPLRQDTRLSCRHHDPERTTPNIRPCARPSALPKSGACGVAGALATGLYAWGPRPGTGAPREQAEKAQAHIGARQPARRVGSIRWWACPRDVLEPPSTANGRQQQQPVNLKLIRAFSRDQRTRTPS